MVGRFADALQQTEGAVVDLEQVRGGDHPDTLDARRDLAEHYWEMGRKAEAMALMEEVVAGRDRILGLGHRAAFERAIASPGTTRSMGGWRRRSSCTSAPSRSSNEPTAAITSTQFRRGSRWLRGTTAPAASLTHWR